MSAADVRVSGWTYEPWALRIQVRLFVPLPLGDSFERVDVPPRARRAWVHRWTPRERGWIFERHFAVFGQLRQRIDA